MVCFNLLCFVETIINFFCLDPSFACGITSSREGYIFTGSSSGNITVLHVPSSDGERISFHSTIPTNDFPILSMASSPSVLACGNDNGDIFGFELTRGTEFERICKFGGSGYPCTSLCMIYDNVFAGYSLGNIKVFNVASRELTIEVCQLITSMALFSIFPQVTAHARAIYGLCAHPSLPIVASCSEDQHLHVWSAGTILFCNGYLRIMLIALRCHGFIKHSYCQESSINWCCFHAW